MFKRAMSNRLVFILLAVLVAIFYSWNLFAFFQGDEWFYFSEFLPLTNYNFGILSAFKKSLLDSFSVSGGGHLTPIYNIVWYLHNKFFGLTYWPYAFLGIFFHIVNSYLVFIFVKNLTKSFKISLCSSIFFGATYVHQHAVTWVMAYVPTVISVTFLLIGLIFLHESITKTKKNIWKIRFAFIAFLAALLTKESTAIIFIIIPIFIILYKKSFKNLYAKYYFILLLFYLPFRFLTPLASLWVTSQVSPGTQTFDFALNIFRIVTYPIKVLGQVFIPGDIVLPIVEYLTPLSYPNYSTDYQVRGSNFLTFTQSAGSDIVYYILGISLIWLIFISINKLRSFKNKDLYKALIIGFAIIIVSSFPLLMISLYAPWWGYVTFIDSRHLYVASIGGAILFALFSGFLSDAISKVKLFKKKSIRSINIQGTLVALWLVVNFALMTKMINFNLEMSGSRKQIIERIVTTVDKQSKQKIILVKSDTGYYGFGPIPPFQTNLGQILSIYFYDMGVLPEKFVHDKYLSSQGLYGQGYLVENGYGFGYYITELDLKKDLVVHNFDLKNIYGYSWEGEGKRLVDYTHQLRSELKEYLDKVKFISGWTNYTNNDLAFEMKIPNDFSQLSHVLTPQQVDNVSFQNQYSQINVQLVKKDEKDLTTFVFENETDSQGVQISKNFTYRNVEMLYQPMLTTLYALTGAYPTYYIPYMNNSFYFRITGTGPEFNRSIDLNGLEKYNILLERIISSIKYEEQ